MDWPLLPLYVLVERICRDAPPPITHAEFYYGFIGLALLWQFIFLLIAMNPARYRSLIALSILEKAAYSVPVIILYSLGKVSPSILWPALVGFSAFSSPRPIFRHAILHIDECRDSPLSSKGSEIVPDHRDRIDAGLSTLSSHRQRPASPMASGLSLLTAVS